MNILATLAAIILILTILGAVLAHYRARVASKSSVIDNPFPDVADEPHPPDE